MKRRVVDFKVGDDVLCVYDKVVRTIQEIKPCELGYTKDFGFTDDTWCCGEENLKRME